MKRWSAKLRLIIFLIVYFVGAILLAVVVVVTSRSINHALDRSRMVSEVQAAAFELSALTTDNLLSPGARAQQQWHGVHDDLTDMVKRGASDPGLSAEEALVIEELQQDLEEIAKAFDWLLAGVPTTEGGSREPPVDAAVEAIAQEELENLAVTRVMIEIQHMISHVSQLDQISGQEIFGALSREKILVVEFVIILLITAGVLALSVYRRTILPLGHLHDAVEAMRDSSLPEPVIPQGDREIMDLTDSFITMRATITSSRDELEAKVSELRDFASIAAHDLREPLRKVRMYGDLLRRAAGSSLGEEEKGHLGHIESTVSRMQTLLDSLLDYTKVTTEARPFSRVRLSRVTDDVLSDLEAVITETGAVVEVGELPVVDADDAQLRQLLQNLIENALKYCRKDVVPVVRISADPADEQTGNTTNEFWRITVEDNGIGFNPEKSKQIFDVFARLHHSKAYPGTGMGLTICRRIAERHGGSISATSTPGKGSRFEVLLPAKQPEHVGQDAADGRQGTFNIDRPDP